MSKARPEKRGKNALTSGRNPKRATVVQPECMEDLRDWVETRPRTAIKILDMMSEVLRTPFTGTGKPEPLKALGPDMWSRRITEEHRLVYKVYDDRIDFLQAKYHY